MKHLLSILFTLFTLFILLTGCNKKAALPEITFYGDTIQINIEDFPVQQVTGTKINLDDIQTGTLCVYDSLAIYISQKFQDFHIRVYNLKSNSFVGAFCKKGRGPEEYLLIGPTVQPVISADTLKLWLYAVSEKKILLFNVTESLKSGTTVVEKVLDAKWDEIPYNFVNFWDEDKFLLKETVVGDVPLDRVTRYQIRNHKTDSTEVTYKIFDIINVPNTERYELYDIVVYYGSGDRLKPDNSKIAMGMAFFPQIHILDLKSGKIKATQIQKFPDWNYVNENPEDIMFYYINIAVTNDFIYALYYNKKHRDIVDAEAYANEVHIFDWDGNLVHIIALDKEIIWVVADPFTNLLYGTTMLDELFCYDLSSILVK